MSADPASREKRAAAAPGLGSQNLGGLRVRRASQSGFLARLRSLGRRDAVFILAGLSVLSMTPLVAHFLTAPDRDSPPLESGFDRRGPLFPDGAGLHEEGTGGFSPGAAVGRDNDVITPLNVRDPSALILGADARPRAPVGSPARAAKAGKKEEWRTALSEAAASGAKEASKQARLPEPGNKLASALRGLAALSGASAGGGPSFKLEPVSAAGVPKRARESAALSPVHSAPGYSGVASRALAPAGSPEAVRAGGTRQADVLNRQGAAASLDAASREHVPAGGAQGGAGTGPGAEGKEPAAAPGRDLKTTSAPENLALLRAKLELERSIDLKYKKKAWLELERRKLVEELFLKLAVENVVGKGLFEPMGRSIADAFGGLMGTKKEVLCVCVEEKACGAVGRVIRFPADDFRQKKDASMDPDWPRGYRCEGAGSSGRGAEGGQRAPSFAPTAAPHPALAGGTGAFGALNEAEAAAARVEYETGEFGADVSGLASDIGRAKGTIAVLASGVESKLQAARDKLNESVAQSRGARRAVAESDAGLREILDKDEREAASEGEIGSAAARVFDALHGGPDRVRALQAARAPESKLERGLPALDLISRQEDALQRVAREQASAEQGLQQAAAALPTPEDLGTLEASLQSLREAEARERIGEDGAPSALLGERVLRLKALVAAAKGGLDRDQAALQASARASAAARIEDDLASDWAERNRARGVSTDGRIGLADATTNALAAFEGDDDPDAALKSLQASLNLSSSELGKASGQLSGARQALGRPAARPQEPPPSARVVL